jgi:hypothetical protein
MRILIEVVIRNEFVLIVPVLGGKIEKVERIRANRSVLGGKMEKVERICANHSCAR